jgi:hypothetical protein
MKRKATGMQVTKQKEVAPKEASREEALIENRRLEWAKTPAIKELSRGGLVLEPNTPESHAVFKDKVRRATGTVDDDAGIMLWLQSVLASRGDVSFEDFAPHGSKALALISGIGPKDTIEGMLATQMVGTHNLAMKFLQRASIQDQPEEIASENINRAAKLLRLYTAQLEALGKYRNKGEQKVTVEHVHVNAGGQAIVGNVRHERGGGGE